jgi:hypothetical protein
MARPYESIPFLYNTGISEYEHVANNVLSRLAMTALSFFYAIDFSVIKYLYE